MTSIAEKGEMAKCDLLWHKMVGVTKTRLYMLKTAEQGAPFLAGVELEHPAFAFQANIKAAKVFKRDALTALEHCALALVDFVQKNIHNAIHQLRILTSMLGNQADELIPLDAIRHGLIYSFTHCPMDLLRSLQRWLNIAHHL